MRRLASIFATLLVFLSSTAAWPQTLPYIVNHVNSLASGASITRPTGGTLIWAGVGATTGAGCTCPAGWNTIVTHTDGTDSVAQCDILSATGTDSFTCNGSTSNVDVSEVSIGNVAASVTPDAFCASQTSGAVFNSCSTTLSHNWDLELQASAGDHMPGPTSGVSWIDSWMNNDTVGFSSDFMYNVLASNPVTVKYELPYNSGPTTQTSAWLAPVNPPATTVNRNIPYRAFTNHNATAGSQSSYSFTPAAWVKSGDLMVCSNIVRSSSITPSCDPAFTPVGSVLTDGSTISGILCTKEAGSNESGNTYNFGLTSTGIQSGSCRTFHNVDLTGGPPYVDVSATASNTTGQQFGTAGVTPGQAGDLILNVTAKAFGESASSGTWEVGDVPFNDGNDIQFVSGIFTSAAAISEEGTSMYIWPVAGPTGIHDMLNAHSSTNGWIAWTLGFKLTAPPTSPTVCNGIIQRMAVPMTTDTNTNTHGNQLNIHYVPYDAVATDLFTFADDTDASTPNNGVAWPQVNFSAPTIQQLSSGVNSEALITAPLTADSPPFAVTNTQAGSNIVAYGTDVAYGNYKQIDSSCESNTAPSGGTSTGCTLTPAKTGELAFDSWTDEGAIAVASTPIVQSSFPSFSNFATGTGYKCLANTNAYTPTMTSSTSSAAGQTLLLLEPNTSFVTGISTLFGPVCGFHGDSCGD